EKASEIGKLLLRGLVVDAVDARRVVLLERFGRGYVSLDHHLLDKPVSLEAFGDDDARDTALGIHDDLALGQVEIERRTSVACPLQRLISGPKRLEHAVHQRFRLVTRLAVECRLRIFVGELRGGSHQSALELVATLYA